MQYLKMFNANNIFNSWQILILIGAIDDKLLEKSTGSLPIKPTSKPKVITPDEAKQIYCRYEESLKIEKWMDTRWSLIFNVIEHLLYKTELKSMVTWNETF